MLYLCHLIMINIEFDISERPTRGTATRAIDLDFKVKITFGPQHKKLWLIPDRSRKYMDAFNY